MLKNSLLVGGPGSEAKAGTGSPVLQSCLPPVGLVCGAHILFLLRGAFHFEPLPLPPPQLPVPSDESQSH